MTLRAALSANRTHPATERSAGGGCVGVTLRRVASNRVLHGDNVADMLAHARMAPRDAKSRSL
jgi:hypothetical protein